MPTVFLNCKQMAFPLRKFFQEHSVLLDFSLENHFLLLRFGLGSGITH